MPNPTRAETGQQSDCDIFQSANVALFVVTARVPAPNAAMRADPEYAA